ncbi:MAG: hypothetical protein IH936_04920 [Acidobacteria bacterium]|nr:hypothetical protein [Acidobacteriota bacterium]
MAKDLAFVCRIGRKETSMATSQESSADNKPAFEHGRLVVHPGALAALEASGELVDGYVERHVRRDWGVIPEEDRKENELSVREGYQILSAYRTHKSTLIWLVTSRDRSRTDILLPEEY